MRITVDKKYLVVPVCYDAGQVKVYFKEDGKLIYDLDICLNPERYDAIYYMDFQRFMGKTFDVEGYPDGMEAFTFTDQPDETGIYEEEARPTVHFTAKKGWINDPNGCVKIGDTYHLYYQHNPVGRGWGNMHWGHAVSKDLVHWVEKDIALFSDETGTMYSGSAYFDRHNATGLGTLENPPMLFFYTAAGGENQISKDRDMKYTQCLAYSLDGGETLIKYDKNPVVPHIVDCNRDPKIIYSLEMGCYYMALYLEGNTYALLTSQNLLDWKEVDRPVMSEDNECPDFYKLPVVDEDDALWILSGAHDRYLVGRLDDEGKFCPIQELSRLQWGNAGYAAQTFSEIRDGRRVKAQWMNMNIPGQYFNCAMNIPTELTLRHEGDRYNLCVQPVRELETLRIRTDSYGGGCVKEGESLSFKTEGKAQDIRLVIKGGQKIDIDFLGQTLHIDNNGCCANVNDNFFPTHPGPQGITLRIISDTLGFEIYAANGEAFAGIGEMADYGKSNFIITAIEGDVEVSTLDISPLENIWKK